jgi:hemoglobin/transferrin/lactoferrin receptor protein
MLTRNASLHRPRFQPKPLVVAIHLGMAGILSVGGITQATAQTAASSRQYDISAGPLDQALTRFAQQTGVAISVDAGQLKGLQTKGLQGSYGVDEGFAVLLRGSGYAIGKTNAGYVLTRAASPDTGSVKAGPTKRDASHADTVLPEIMVTAITRTANPLSKVPASVSVVTQDDFEEQQATTVSAALKKLPNVEFGGGPRVNGEIPTIRGVSGPSITLLVDGARQNDTTSPSLKSPLFIDPYFLRQAEIVRGPASSLYGSGGNGGVMAFTTLSARDLLTPGQNIGGGAKLAHNAADKSSRLNVRLYGGNDVVDGLIALGSNDWNKIRQGGGSYLAPNDGEAATGIVKLGIQPIADGRIELSHQFYKSDNLQVNNGQATDYRTANAPLDKPAVQMIHVDQTNTILKGMLGKVDGAPALVATLYKTTLQYESDRSPDPAITNVLYSNTKTDTDGASLQGTRVFDGAGWGRHRVTAGLDYFKDKQTAVSATIANPSAPSSVTRNGMRDVSGVFIQDEIALGGGWNLTPSLRSDRYKASVTDGSLADNSESRVSPKLSVAWQDGNGLMLYGNLGEAFRAPTIVELYQNLTTFALNNFLPNPTLRPEIDKTVELGANFGRKSTFIADDHLKLRTSVFNSRVTDLIYNTSLGGMTPTGFIPPGQNLALFAANCAATGLNCKYQFQNVSDASRNGVEIEGGYSLGKWQFNAAYSRVRIENRGNSDKLFSPPDKLSLQVRRQLPAQNMTILWNTTGVSAQDYDSTVLRRRPGYATHDLFASWMPSGQRFKLDAGITNLFDKRYSAYQSSNAYSYTYQEGRSLKLAVSMDF